MCNVGLTKHDSVAGRFTCFASGPSIPLVTQVGAAVSMVYASGAPIMFVGCGQTYVDLKRLNVKSVVRSLLK